MASTAPSPIQSNPAPKSGGGGRGNANLNISFHVAGLGLIIAIIIIWWLFSLGKWRIETVVGDALMDAVRRPLDGFQIGSVHGEGRGKKRSKSRRRSRRRRRRRRRRREKSIEWCVTCFLTSSPRLRSRPRNSRKKIWSEKNKKKKDMKYPEVERRWINMKSGGKGERERRRGGGGGEMKKLKVEGKWLINSFQNTD